jgi:hypothetical protein
MKAKKNIAPEVKIEITPTLAEYQQLCEDLFALRRRGASSNTAAILDAVHAAAQHRKIRSSKAPKRSRGARQRPPVQQEMEVPDAP